VFICLIFKYSETAKKFFVNKTFGPFENQMDAIDYADKFISKKQEEENAARGDGRFFVTENWSYDVTPLIPHRPMVVVYGEGNVITP